MTSSEIDAIIEEASCFYCLSPMQMQYIILQLKLYLLNAADQLIPD